MSLMNIKTKSQSGFTIVELLIVVVVIAILAAITLVSFNNITNRANDSSAKETAANVQKKAELYNAENSAYPKQLSDLTSGNNSWTLSPASMIQGSDPTPTNGKSTVRINKCTTGTSPNDVGVGVQIVYWEYNKTGGAGLTTINVGTTSGAGVTCAAMS